MEATQAERREHTDIDQRDRRALTEYMTVLPLGGEIYSVTTQSGSEYRVDARSGRCSCPDHMFRGTECKHIRRVAFATGDRAIPAWVHYEEIDPKIGEHVDGTPRIAATDGGTASVGSSDIDEEGCWCDEHDFPCFECYRTGRCALPSQ